MCKCKSCVSTGIPLSDTIIARHFHEYMSTYCKQHAIIAQCPVTYLPVMASSMIFISSLPFHKEWSPCRCEAHSPGAYFESREHVGYPVRRPVCVYIRVHIYIYVCTCIYIYIFRERERERFFCKSSTNGHFKRDGTSMNHKSTCYTLILVNLTSSNRFLHSPRTLWMEHEGEKGTPQMFG